MQGLLLLLAEGGVQERAVQPGFQGGILPGCARPIRMERLGVQAMLGNQQGEPPFNPQDAPLDFLRPVLLHAVLFVTAEGHRPADDESLPARRLPARAGVRGGHARQDGQAHLHGGAQADSLLGHQVAPVQRAAAGHPDGQVRVHARAAQPPESRPVVAADGIPGEGVGGWEGDPVRFAAEKALRLSLAEQENPVAGRAAARRPVPGVVFIGQFALRDGFPLPVVERALQERPVEPLPQAAFLPGDGDVFPALRVIGHAVQYFLRDHQRLIPLNVQNAPGDAVRPVAGDVVLLVAPQEQQGPPRPVRPRLLRPRRRPDGRGEHQQAQQRRRQPCQVSVCFHRWMPPDLNSFPALPSAGFPSPLKSVPGTPARIAWAPIPSGPAARRCRRPCSGCAAGSGPGRPGRSGRTPAPPG